MAPARPYHLIAQEQAPSGRWRKCGGKALGALLLRADIGPQESFVSVEGRLVLVARLGELARQHVGGRHRKGRTWPSHRGHTERGFHASISKVPPSLTLPQLPSSAARQVPAAKNFEYAKLQNNEVLLVDPKNREVADMIMPSSTTGSK